MNGAETYQPTSNEMQYDPDDVDIRLEHFTVEEMVKLIEINKLEIIEENDLQRLPDSWDVRKKSLLIESLMIKIPLPVFYLDGSEKLWQVIDGLQRLTTLYQFISKKSSERFVLSQLEYLRKEYHQHSFDSLPLFMKRRILDSSVEAYIINPGTPLAVKYNIFNRINTLGVRLKMQEVRNAIFRGVASNFTKELAGEEAFKIATNYKVSAKRMDDREYVTRFVTFQWFLDEYASDMDDFLRKGMLKLAEVPEYERHEMRNCLIETMKRVHSLFGSYCFFRIEPSFQPKGNKPNKALFDALSWNISKLSANAFEKLLRKKETIYPRYVNFMNNNVDFSKSINDTTASKKSVVTRFTLFKEFLNGEIHDSEY